MVATRLTTENVRIILSNFLNDVEYGNAEGKEAEKQLCYIAGATDMANAVIRTIEEFGGK